MRVLWQTRSQRVSFMGESPTDRYCASRQAAQGAAETRPPLRENWPLHKPSVTGQSPTAPEAMCLPDCWVCSSFEALTGSDRNSLVRSSVLNPASLGLMLSLPQQSTIRSVQENSRNTTKENCRTLAARENFTNQMWNPKSLVMFPSLAKVSYAVSVRTFKI